MISSQDYRLLRCTAVCKLWYLLITSSSFISSHLKLTLCKNQNPIFVNFCTKDYESGSSFGHYYIQSFDKIEKLVCPITLRNDYYRFNIIGSFNGLYCLYDEDAMSKIIRLILWNPSLKKSLTLPDSRVMGKSLTHVIGFGFLPETNEYKVVKTARRNGSRGWSTLPKPEIFNLSTGNWTDMDAIRCPYTIKYLASQAFLKDSVHWAAYDRNWSGAIVSINLKTEKFATLITPDACHSDCQVSTYKDLLCLIQRPEYLGDKVCSVWVMNEYGVKSSWVKKYRIDKRDHPYSTFELLSFSANSDTLLAVGSMSGGDMFKSKLVCFDAKHKEVTNLGELGDAKSLYVDTYMESLVLIDVPDNNALSRYIAC